jgi:histone H2A
VNYFQIIEIYFLLSSAGFPKQTAAQTILAALSKYFRQTATTNLQQVFFVLYDAESVNVYTTELQRMVE